MSKYVADVQARIAFFESGDTILPFMKMQPQTIERVRGYLRQVERVLARETHASDGLTRNISRQVFSAKGKRIRPALLMLTYQAVRRKGEAPSPSVVTLAAMIEMIHTASVIHDDIIDESLLRRGQDVLHRQWGEKMSILMGDFLYARSAMLIASHGNMEVLAVVSRAVSDMCRGEMHEISNAFNMKLTDQQYFKIIRDKTGILFSAACEVGAIMAKATPSARRAAARYGMELGFSFQIMDDVLDLTASTDHLGKPAGSDLREGRITLPFILALRKASAKDRAVIQKLSRNQSSQLAEMGSQLTHQFGGIDAAKEVVRRSVARALDSVVGVGNGAARSTLESVARLAVERTH